MAGGSVCSHCDKARVDLESGAWKRMLSVSLLVSNPAGSALAHTAC